MRLLHFEKDSDLFRALRILQEDSNEKEKQEKMSRRLKGARIDEKDEEEKEDKEEKSSDSNDKEKSDNDGNKKNKKDNKLPGAKRLEDAELSPGQMPTSLEIAQRINFIRAGASLKDDKVKKDIAVWIMQLSEPERLAVYTTLDALAQIVLGRKSGTQVPTFSDIANFEIKGVTPSNSSKVTKNKKSISTKSTKSTKSTSVASSPIVVGEGVIKRLKEIDVPVSTGRVVPFGSKSHISDIENRISDLKRIRSYQERGSDTHHILGLAITALKKQLLIAQKRNGSGNPRTQPVPPMVEKEK